MTKKSKGVLFLELSKRIKFKFCLSVNRINFEQRV